MRQHWLIFALSFLFSASFLPAQTWVQQYPNHRVYNLKDISFNDQGKGIAVGEGTTLLTSPDWGNTWIEQGFSPVSTIFYKVGFAPEPGSSVAYLMDHARLYKSTDAGLNWTLLSLQVGVLGTNKLLEVISENEVFALGSTGILHTSDGGVSWNLIDKPSPDINIRSFQFMNPQLGWIGATNGDIFGTTDGGANWVPLDTSQFDKTVTLRFLDANIGFAGIDRALVKTIDGGHTWTVINSTAFPTNITEIGIADANNIFFTYGNRVYYTYDGGTVLDYRQPFGYSGNPQYLFVLPGGRIWVVSHYLSIGFSSDNGATYTEQVPGNKNYLQYIKMVDKDHGWATGFNFSIFKTANGGDTWEDISPTPTISSMKLVRRGLGVSENEFWVCGGNFVTKTTDGGMSWTTISQGPGAVNDLEATSSTVYAAHTNGRVYKTTNGGANWTFADVQSQSNLVALSFPTDDVGYVVGWAGMVAKTTDAGLSWTVLDFPTVDNIGEIFFLDENTGWVSPEKFSDIIYKTTDGGQTWTPITLPSATYWYNIQFFDTQTGFVSGGSSGSGRMIRTSDGGQTWIEIFSDTQITKGLSVIKNANGYLMWLCGSGGSIYHAPLLLSAIFDQDTVEPLTLFPNPASSSVSITNAGQFSQEAELTILDLQGSVVAREIGVPEVISLESLSSGMYLVRILDGAKIYVGKLAVD